MFTLLWPVIYFFGDSGWFWGIAMLFTGIPVFIIWVRSQQHVRGATETHAEKPREQIPVTALLEPHPEPKPAPRGANLKQRKEFAMTGIVLVPTTVILSLIVGYFGAQLLATPFALPSVPLGYTVLPPELLEMLVIVATIVSSEMLVNYRKKQRSWKRNIWDYVSSFAPAAGLIVGLLAYFVAGKEISQLAAAQAIFVGYGLYVFAYDVPFNLFPGQTEDELYAKAFEAGRAKERSEARLVILSPTDPMFILPVRQGYDIDLERAYVKRPD